jgi:aminopeptidase
MKDLRLEKLAKNLLTHSCKLQKGQSIIIEGSSESRDLIVEIVKQVYKLGAFPFVRLGDEQIGRATLMGITEELSKRMCKYAMPLFEDCNAYIGIRASRNEFEGADVPTANKVLHAKHFGKPIHMDTRAVKHNWVILNYPNPSMAQMAQTSVEAFEDFYFDVCTMDYSKMHNAMVPLKELMEKTDRVRIVAPDTDLSFSIKGQKAKICSGECNIPDGEIYTSPLKTSINGKIRFNTPSTCKGITHTDICLTFRDGKVIEEHSSNTDALTAELNSDEGARYTGEFAFGVNPYIKKPMNDILFDEKISGSIHIALGNCYDDCPNGNKSQIHWDLILRDCDVYLDDVLVRKGGKFMPKQLQALEKLI